MEENKTKQPYQHWVFWVIILAILTGIVYALFVGSETRLGLFLKGYEAPERPEPLIQDAGDGIFVIENFGNESEELKRLLQIMPSNKHDRIESLLGKHCHIINKAGREPDLETKSFVSCDNKIRTCEVFVERDREDDLNVTCIDENQGCQLDIIWGLDAKGYYCGSAGHVSQDAVKRYILEQEGKDVFEYSVFESSNQKIGQFAQTKLGDFNA